MKTLAGADRTIERRAKTVLGVTLLLAVAIIYLGIYGMRTLNQSGFDDAKGFWLIYDAGRSAERNSDQDAELLRSLPEDAQRAVEAVMDATIRALWQRVRYAGETTQDFARADALKRQSFMQSLLLGTQDAELQRSTRQAAEALSLVREGMTADGTPAFEKLMDDVASLLPASEAQSFRERLADLLRTESTAVQEDIRRRSRALFEEAVAEKRLSRFTKGGAGLIPLAGRLFDELDSAAPTADISSAFDLVKQVPRQREAYASLFNLPAHEGTRRILDMLDAEEM